MVSNHRDALKLALDVWKMEEPPHGPEYMIALARTGVFTHMEIAAITSKPPSTVLKQSKGVPEYKFGQKFDPRALDALLLMELQWRYSGEVQQATFDLVHPACSRTVISRLTGVPLEALPRAA